MLSPTADWERRVAELWEAADGHDHDDFFARMRALGDELPSGHPVAAYEMASAYDFFDKPTEAAELYRQALESDLDDYRRRCAVIQLASTLRNLGQSEQSVALLTAERNRNPGSLAENAVDLGEAVEAFLALALADVGREREAVGVALGALARRMPHYRRSLTNYAAELCGSPES